MRKAISLALINDKRLLIVRKNLTWILPGGKPKKGENDYDCLKREFSQELPFLEMPNASSLAYYKKFRGITPHKGDLLEDTVYVHTSHNEDDNIMPSAEINDSKFCYYDELDSIELSDITSKIVKSLNRDKYL